MPVSTTDSGGIGGSGGAASSSAAARNAGASAVTARAEAYGGTAGLGGSEGDPGDAESNAHAVGLGEVLASAVARAGATSTYSSLVDSTALANATGAGSSGMASALAESASNLTRTTFVTTRAFASATVLEDATATARSVRNGQLSPDDLAIAADAAALVTAGGTETTVWGSAALVLADDQLRDDGSITLHAEADFTGIAQPGALEAGVFVSFLAFELDETDFESLSFRIDNGAQAVLERIFQDAASALAFFTGPALELENLAGMMTVAGQFDLRFNLDLVSSRAGDRVGALFALGTAPVPEPGTGALLALGLIAIAARRGRTRPRSAARLFAMV